MKRVLFFGLIFVCLFTRVLPASDAAWITGLVVSVHDGDTLTLLKSGGKKLRIRLEGIDAPEMDQPYGDASRQVLDDMVYRHEVTVRTVAIDKYGRTVGRVFDGELDVSLEMVRQGMAWRFDRFSLEEALGSTQAQARALRMGLWQDSHPTPPWVWRDLHPHR